MFTVRSVVYLLCFISLNTASCKWRACV